MRNVETVFEAWITEDVVEPLLRAFEVARQPTGPAGAVTADAALKGAISRARDLVKSRIQEAYGLGYNGIPLPL